MRKWEISLLVGVAVTLLWCTSARTLTMQWWTAAFSPLCDGLTGGAAEGGIELRCALWDFLKQCVQ